MKFSSLIKPTEQSPFAGKLLVTAGRDSILMCLYIKDEPNEWCLPSIYIDRKNRYSQSIYSHTGGRVLSKDCPFSLYQIGEHNVLHLHYNSRFNADIKRSEQPDVKYSNYRWFTLQELKEIASNYVPVEGYGIWKRHLSLLLDIFEFEDCRPESVKEEKN